MNRKMTRFAFAAKCGGRGASGSAAGRAEAGSPRRSARAIAPSPTPHCWRNQRRATSPEVAAAEG